MTNDTPTSLSLEADGLQLGPPALSSYIKSILRKPAPVFYKCHTFLQSQGRLCLCLLGPTPPHVNKQDGDGWRDSREARGQA